MKEKFFIPILKGTGLLVLCFGSVYEVKGVRSAGKPPSVILYRAMHALQDITMPQKPVGFVYQPVIQTAEEILQKAIYLRLVRDNLTESKRTEMDLRDLIIHLEKKQGLLQAQEETIDPRFNERMAIIREQIGRQIEALNQEQNIDVNAEIYFDLGMAKIRHFKDYKGGMECFKISLGINPDYSLAHYGKGLVNARRGNVEKALESFNRAIALDSTNAAAYSERAMIYSNSSNYEEAIKDWDIFIQLKPDNAKAYLERGLCKVRLAYKEHGGSHNWVQIQENGDMYIETFIERLKSALPDYRKATELEPRYAGFPESLQQEISSVRENFANELFVQLLRQVTSEVEDEAKVLGGLDTISRLAPGKYGVFQTAFHDGALSLQQNVAYAFVRMGLQYMSKLDYESALESFGKAVDLYSELAEAYYLMGTIFMQLKNYESAIEAYTQAINLGSGHNYYVLSLDQRQEAYQHLGKSVQTQ